MSFVDYGKCIRGQPTCIKTCFSVENCKRCLKREICCYACHLKKNIKKKGAFNEQLQ